jgi:hypothetical protein
MNKKLLWLLLVNLLALTLVFAGTGKKRGGQYAEPFKDDQPFDPAATYNAVPPPHFGINTVGTSTTLSGFYDYQSNGGSIQHLRVNPANGNIHVTYMLADDSTAGGLNNARRVAYAFSSNSGSTWNNFSNVRVPARRAGFPTLDLLRGTNAGLPAIANHSVVGTPLVSTIFVDSPEGSGAFSEIAPPPQVAAGTDEPIWPYVAGASDGSVVMAASRSAAATAWWTRTADLSVWSAFAQVTEVTQSGGRYPVQANGTGRVGILYNTSNGTAVLGNWWLESTNNGQTWSTPSNIFPFRAVGADTFNSYVHCDFVYNGNTPLFAFSEYQRGAVDFDVPRISFWSQAGGFRLAVPFDSAKYARFVNVDQRFHSLVLGWPSIGMSGSTIVVAYQAFQPDTDSRGYNYSDIWYVKSDNGGTTWSAPKNITNTPNIDERYPSVSKWNANGHFNIVWGQKNKSGLYAFPGTADTVRSTQMFLRVNLTDVDDDGVVANSFKLTQNYPNPFNPGTKIDYTVGQAGPVTIKVYNTLGQEVATLVNENLAAGTYQATFDGAKLASGVYLYKMTAGSYVESKKMILMK